MADLTTPQPDPDIDPELAPVSEPVPVIPEEELAEHEEALVERITVTVVNHTNFSFLIRGFDDAPERFAPGVTHDVPAGIWDAWRERHADSDFVVSGLISAE